MTDESDRNADIRIDIEGGKYTVVMSNNGGLHALRFGEPWRSLTGDKLVYALAAEVERLRKKSAGGSAAPITDAERVALSNWHANQAKSNLLTIECLTAMADSPSDSVVAFHKDRADMHAKTAAILLRNDFLAGALAMREAAAKAVENSVKCCENFSLEYVEHIPVAQSCCGNTVTDRPDQIAETIRAIDPASLTEKRVSPPLNADEIDVAVNWRGPDAERDYSADQEAVARRPAGSNADEWSLFLEYWCGPIQAKEFVAVQIAEAIDAALLRQPVAPIPMLLYCPLCNVQHVDEPQPKKNWDNPPHRSHECQSCGHVWRPADVPTVGVAEIATKGKRDGSAAPVAPVVDDAMRAALQASAERFREYERLHAAKPDMEKAKRNAEMAEMCEAALKGEK